MPPRKLPAKLEALVSEALSPQEPSLTPSTFKLAALAQALTEAGIPSKVVVCTVAFDPEHWTNPECVEAIRIKSCITDGMGTYGWPALIEKARDRLGYAGDYVDQQNKSSTTWEELYKLNQGNFGSRLQDDLARMRAFVQQWSLDQQAPIVTAPPRRPGL